MCIHGSQLGVGGELLIGIRVGFPLVCPFSPPFTVSHHNWIQQSYRFQNNTTRHSSHANSHSSLRLAKGLCNNGKNYCVKREKQLKYRVIREFMNKKNVSAESVSVKRAFR